MLFQKPFVQSDRLRPARGEGLLRDRGLIPGFKRKQLLPGVARRAPAVELQRTMTPIVRAWGPPQWGQGAMPPPQILEKNMLCILN